MNAADIVTQSTEAAYAAGHRAGLEEAAAWCDAEADGIRKRMQAFGRMNCDDSVRDLTGELARARTRAASIRALIKEPKV